MISKGVKMIIVNIFFYNIVKYVIYLSQIYKKTEPNLIDSV